MDEKGFINTRARFQRISDAKFFAGWVRDFNISSIIVALSTDAELCPGDRFMFEVHGHHAGASFPAELMVVSGEEYLFSIPQQLRLTTPREEARVFVNEIAGIIQGDLVEVDILVIDVSQKGAGVLAPTPLTVGEKVMLSVETEQGSVQCAGEVRYCRADKAWGQYRAGLLLDDMGRVERAKWAKLVGGSAAA